MIVSIVTKLREMSEGVITLLVSTVTGVLTFIVGQQRAKRESENVALKNVQSSIDIYKTIIDDLKGEISELLIKVDKLEKKVDDLMEENTKLKEILNKKKRS